MWKCKKCNEEVEEQFEICWNCSHDKSGNIVINKTDEKEINVYETLENLRKAQPKVIKQANEYGIAGFVFSLVLPLYTLVWLPNGVPHNIFNRNTDSINFWTLAFFLILAIILSIIGVSKNGKHFEKGIAFSGLFFNLSILLNLLRQII